MHKNRINGEAAFIHVLWKLPKNIGLVFVIPGFNAKTQSIEDPCHIRRVT